MDDLAQRYLLLLLRLGRHLAGLLEWYAGPPELREAVAGEPLTPPVELHDEALRLATDAGDLRGDGLAEVRWTWMTAQLRAVSALARRLDGEEIAYVDLVEELCDAPAELEAESVFASAHRRLDGLLPGSEPLARRLAAHDDGLALPAERLPYLVPPLVETLRRRTREDIWLPERESVDVRLVGFESPLEASRFQYVGRLRSVVALDPSAAWTAIALPDAIAGLTYPGRHAEAATKDAVLVREHGHAEMAIGFRATPEAVVSAGLADAARDAVLTDTEAAFQARVLARAAGLRADMALAVAVSRARRPLAAAIGNAALLLHQRGAPEQEVRSYLADVALVAPSALDTQLRSLRGPLRAITPLAAAAGARIVREWLEVHGTTRGLGRLLSEPLTPGRLLEGAGSVAPALYPAAFD